MDFIATQDRHQITIGALADKISPDNSVRFIDAFVEHTDLENHYFNWSHSYLFSGMTTPLSASSAYF